ncbi:MAG: hypothetical protein GVY16_07230 [Planctomycetes bacterium]|jgi:hypothetical protein|nr:hypothetical protein [Planctomycetota bacterium]
MPAEPNNHVASADAGGDGRFQLITLGLLVVIIVALAGLWIVERGRSRGLQEDLDTVQRRVAEQNDTVRAVLGLQPPAAIDRSSLPQRQATLNGEERRVLLLDADRAETLGLQVGDVVQVAEPSFDANRP